MNARDRYTGAWHQWRRGILFVVLCLVIAGLATVIYDKAYAAKGADTRTTQRNVPCGAGDPCPWSDPVSSKRMGVRKFRNHRLGKTARPHYSRHNKRVIIDNLMRAQRQHNRQVTRTSSDNSALQTQARMMTLSRTQMWAKFTSTDNCYYTWQNTGGGGGQQARVWTCSKYNTTAPDGDYRLNDATTRGFFCGGIAAIGVGGAVAAGATGPWTWAGIGAGAAYCMWGHYLSP